MIKKNTYLIAAAVSNTLFRYSPFDFYFGNPLENHTSYAVGQALSYIFLLAYGYKNTMPKMEKIIYEIVFWCAISNLWDELFGDPLTFGLNEVFFTIFIIVSTLARIKYIPGNEAGITRDSGIT